MIEHLSIRNFAIVDHIEIDFGPGLNIITGETGAGKSIVVGAFSLLLGQRGERDLVKPGAEEAVLEALFRVSEYPEVLKRLEEAGFESKEDLLIRRTLNSVGKSKIFLNGQLASLNILENVGEPLVEICSQHESTRFLKPWHQLEIIDKFGKLQNECDEVEEAFQKINSIIEEYNKHMESGLSPEREEFLRFQIKEIESIELIEGEDEELILECKRLEHSEKFTDFLSTSLKLLEAEDGAVLSKISQVKDSLQKLSQIDPLFLDAAERIDKCKIELEDIAFTLSKLGSNIELNPNRLEQINKRIAKINSLKRKHGSTIGEILQRLDVLKEELHALEHFEERKEELKKKIRFEEIIYATSAEKLSAKRKKVASKLSKQIEQVLLLLGMPKVQFVIDISTRPIDEKLSELFDSKKFFGPKGFDKTEMLFTSNPGIEPRTLSKIASGGELSRITLAIKKIIAESGGTSVYLFDEVDAGIGGAVADVVGQNLREVSRHNQVVCITHLPQVAAYADNHFIVSKEHSDKTTSTTIKKLSEKERTNEIARMLGGVKITQTTTKHAAEMLKMAKNSATIQ